MLSVQKVFGGYAGKSIVKNVSFEVGRGELFGILGPNGSGKTTLLKMLSGILPVSSGNVMIKGKSIKDYSPKELAKIIAVLPQHSSQAFSYTVKETVSLGRYAHQKGWFQSWSIEDEEAVNRVMEQTGISKFQNQDIQQLSGGERQRVFLAQALAQNPEILLLDEPTNHLDLSYQKELLDLLKTWAKDCGLTVISIFHDLNLAGLYCDRLLLLENGEINIDHVPNEVLKEERIRDVYKTRIEKQPHPRVPAPQMVLVPEKTAADEQKLIRIDESLLQQSEEMLILQSPIPMRTMSSGVVGSGTGWNRNFVNRHVSKDYDCSDHRLEMADYIKKQGFEPGETVGMMTAVYLEDFSCRLYEDEDFSVYIVVTAGVGNAIDASRSKEHSYHMTPGTINTWVFVNGNMTEEAFIQCIMTATEAKTKAMQDQQVMDAVTGTIATGTSTDSILIAATQQGEKLEYAGTITPLGKVVGKGVYECTAEAIQNSKRRIKQ
ncbi:adenosylcobinamide amidohydrolase [Bacillus sp. ISL-47]|uniref:adenosylcobinamide amidohydrolase n=1 Tax=Bacillus sp. ISL-47 TaxID=2819130 RepID=UPI001BE53A0A|nr:adenosylcobinamide amidohydrolase [Bacillus sp. ISL-47]MBT2689172.1 adenosylcobinamide amidohydrolase [Bacillus sp. ISL-47]MBT2710298.1 adenosylcobinamide amidohydrolase [Pseudomonas sp. ISL-84]